MKLVLPLFIATLNAACQSEPPLEAIEESAAVTPSASGTSLSNRSDNATVPQLEQSQTEPTRARINNSAFTSDYTDINKAKCKTVEMDVEGAGYLREQCGDYKGIPLFRVEGDLRQSAYAGNEPSGQTTIAPFNYLGDKVEWRMQAGTPIALIYRLRADAPDMPGDGRTQLFVQKIGIGDEQSCIIGLVAGNYPKANEKARQIADTAAAITCSDDYQPNSFGDLL